MQKKPNFSNRPMSINPVKTNYYEHKTPLRPPPKQTQSNPIKPNFNIDFEREIGFERSKPQSNERSCVCFLGVYTKKYMFLEQILLFLKLFFPILCAEFCLTAPLPCFQLHKDLMNKSLCQDP